MFRLALAVALCTSPLAAADPPASRNAATQYALAFYALGGGWRTPDGWDPLADWATVPLDDERLDWLRHGPTPLKYLRRGAALDECVWPSDVNAPWDGPVGVLTPQTDQGRSLVALAALRARWNFEHGRPESAFADLLAALKFVHHVRHQKGSLPYIAGNSMEFTVWKCLAMHVGRADRVALAAFLREYQRLPKPTTAAEAIRSEGDLWAAWFATRGLRAMNPLPGEEEFNRDPDDGQLGTLRYFTGLETEQEAVLEFVAATHLVFGRAAEVAAVPVEKLPDAFAAHDREFGDAAPAVSEDPIVDVYAKLIAPSGKIRLSELRAAAVRGMVLAAVRSKAEGKAEPAGTDPHTGKPFAVTPTADGFELRTPPTPLIKEPVVMTVRTK